jgi:enoyl-CoA hydratase/carnithine racemase
VRNLDTGTDELLCAIDSGVATITLNRPEKRNALSDRLTPALRNVLPVLEADTDVRVIVLTGAGKAFCSGGDVSGMGERRAPVTTEAAIRRLQHGQETLTLRLFDLTKPTIAALPGAAAGAGMSIALACDLRIAAESAIVTTAFANIGLSGDYGGSWLLTRLVGTAKAKELYFTSRRVTAAEALTLGIVNEVVSDDRLMARTKELAGQIAAGPPIALGYMKENLNRAIGADLKTALALEADRMVRCNRTEDHKEAVRAFLEKRKPVFSGK